MRRDQLHLMVDMLLDMGQKLFSGPMVPEAAQHLRVAKREALLGVRAMVDAALERLDEKKPGAATPGPKSISIE